MSSYSKPIIDFALTLTSYLLEHSDKINLSVSTTSIYFALVMVQIGSKNQSRLELEKLLGADFSSLLSPHYKTSQLFVSTMENYENLSLSGELYSKIFTAVKLKKDYTHILTELFNITTQTISFQPPSEAVKIINDWVAESTHGRITNMLKESVITPESVMVLINTIYFKGFWKDSFDEKLTQDEEFYLESGVTIIVPFMQQTHKTKFYDDKKDRFKALIMDFKKGNYIGVFLLPKQRITLKQLIMKLDVGDFKACIEGSQTHSVDIKIPKFKLDKDTNVKRILINLGVTSIFDKNTSDLTNISNLPLWVDDIIHRSTVEIDEKGVVAAASTAVVISIMSYIPEQQFQADRPFLFIIMDRKSGIPLFMNAIYDPSKS